jgi:lysophospholipase L1-like esterase
MARPAHAAKAALVLGFALVLACAKPAADPAPPIAPGAVVLFLGDSITDAGRSRERATEANQQEALGNGYAWLAAAGLLTSGEFEDLRIYNRGIVGNKVFHMVERWDRDCLAFEPDVVSILIGVNDALHAKAGHEEGSVARYEEGYDQILTRTREARPDVKLVVCEPFVLPSGGFDKDLLPGFEVYRAAAKRVAEKHGAIFVPFQSMFDAAQAYAAPTYWASDGIHATEPAAALMAEAWLRAVRGAE